MVLQFFLSSDESECERVSVYSTCVFKQDVHTSLDHFCRFVPWTEKNVRIAVIINIYKHIYPSICDIKMHSSKTIYVTEITFHT